MTLKDCAIRLLTMPATYTHQMLCNELASKNMLPYITTIKARDVSEFSTWIRHADEEFMYVISGELNFISERYRPVKKAPKSCGFHWNCRARGSGAEPYSLLSDQVQFTDEVLSTGLNVS